MLSGVVGSGIGLFAGPSAKDPTLDYTACLSRFIDRLSRSRGSLLRKFPGVSGGIHNSPRC